MTLTASSHRFQTMPILESATETTWLEIDASSFRHNLYQYRSIIGDASLAPVIKSNAYGHGIELVARLCEQHNAVDWICVISVHEALMPRAIGITKPLLVLSILNGDLGKAIAKDIDFVLYTWQDAYLLNAQALALGKRAFVHIKIDTGLSRLGTLWYEAMHFILAVAQLPNIVIRGIFTHFADAENDDPSFCQLQLQRFHEVLRQAEQEDISITFRHATCSAATSAHIASHFNFIRVGIGLYGLWPSIQNKMLTRQKHSSFSLQPVLTWKTRILQIKTVPAGSFIGYDRTHQASVSTTIATLPVGYWDGYDRGLSNKAQVLVNGHLAQQIGRIAMNLMMIDITSISAQVGDTVTLLGTAPGITADDLALHGNTINYEIVTRINPLLPRILV